MRTGEKRTKRKNCKRAHTQTQTQSIWHLNRQTKEEIEARKINIIFLLVHNRIINDKKRERIPSQMFDKTKQKTHTNSLGSGMPIDWLCVLFFVVNSAYGFWAWINSSRSCFSPVLFLFLFFICSICQSMSPSLSFALLSAAIFWLFCSICRYMNISNTVKFNLCLWWCTLNNWNEYQSGNASPD